LDPVEEKVKQIQMLGKYQSVRETKDKLE